MKKIIFVLLCIITINAFSQNQGITNWWNVGYESYTGPPFGHTTFNFFNGVPVLNPDSIPMDLDRTSANISDTSGNLLFYTNGYYIADATNDTMQNGNNISPTGFMVFQPEGLTVTQACLIIPKPGNPNIYYLFHNTVDNYPYYNKSLKQYVSTIDMSLNGGLGGVVNKNTVLVQDTLNAGKITACKHANGRDWWVIVQRANSNAFYKFLVSPNGISAPITQNLGNVRSHFLGMAAFSPDGKKYASFHAEYTTTGELDIFDFDRCNGVLSNPVHIVIPQSTGLSGGIAFSSNSRFLYTANIDSVYQYDMTSANISISKQIVAAWDSFYSPHPPFATLFEVMQLAPDGKIYITTGNGTLHIHVINDPDSAGLACNLVQHAIQFQYFYANGIPNHPNYFLGCDSTCGPCMNTGFANLLTPKGGIRVTPNPTTGIFTLQFAVQSASGLLEVYDVMGNVVLRDYVAPWSQFKKVDISLLTEGVYLCKIKWKNFEASVKIIKN